MNPERPEPSHKTPLRGVTVIATAFCLPLIAASGIARAQPPGPYPGGAPAGTHQGASPDWRWSVSGGGIYQWNADMDNGGDFSSARLYLQGGATRSLGNGNSVGISIGYGRDEYDFGGSSGLGALDPWDAINSLRVSVPLRWRANEQWTVFAVPSLRSAGESGADFDDSLFGGLLAGASYRFSDNLSIGPGLGVFSNIEDGANVFPVLLVDWKLTERLSLRTGRGLAATRGPGLTLEWKPSSPWTLGLGARYEKFRFRLDDKGVAAGGVGQEKGIPLFVSAGYAFSPDIKINLLAGVTVGGQLRLEDEDGDRITDSDFDPAPFLGLVFDARL